MIGILLLILVWPVVYPLLRMMGSFVTFAVAVGTLATCMVMAWEQLWGGG
jgi:hypothetical protein